MQPLYGAARLAASDAAGSAGIIPAGAACMAFFSTEDYSSASDMTSLWISSMERMTPFS